MILTVDKNGTELAWNKMPVRGHSIFDSKIQSCLVEIETYQKENPDVLKNPDKLKVLKGLHESYYNAYQEYEDSEGWVGGGTLENKQYDLIVEDCCITVPVVLPKGTIFKLTGRNLTWNDEPICLN